MTKYLISMQTNIITVDDINLNFIIKQIKDEKELTFSSMRKIRDLLSFNSVNASLIVATLITSIELICSNNIENKPESYKNVYALVYALKDDEENNLYIETKSAESLEACNFNNRIKEIKDAKEIMQSEIGSIDSTINTDCTFKININEKKSNKILIKLGIDKFDELNRKIYECDIEKI